MEKQTFKIINMCGTDIYFCTEEGEVITLKSEGKLPLKISKQDTEKVVSIEGVSFPVRVSYFSSSIVSEMKRYLPEKEGVLYLVPPYIKHGVFPHRTDVVVIGSFEIKNGRKHATSLCLPQIEPRKHFKNINRELVKLANNPERLPLSLVIIKKSIEPILRHGKNSKKPCQEE